MICSSGGGFRDWALGGINAVQPVHHAARCDGGRRRKPAAVAGPDSYSGIDRAISCSRTGLALEPDHGPQREHRLVESVIVLFFALLALPPIAHAQAASPLTTDQVVSQLVQHNQRRAALLTHYQGCRLYSVAYVGFPSDRSAVMVVDMAYDAPAQKQFRVVKEQGSKLLLDTYCANCCKTRKRR